MDRRTFLGLGTVAVSGGVTGCVGGLGSRSLRRTIELVQVEELPADLETEATVKVLEPEITSDHTARLQVAVRNSSETRRAYVFDPGGPMWRERGSGPNLLLLAEPHDLKRKNPDCWRPGSVGHGDGTMAVELSAGKDIQNTLELWDIEEKGDNCLPPGEYRFTDWVRLERQDTTYKWSLTLRLERP